jgi:hypothetical protein
MAYIENEKEVVWSGTLGRNKSKPGAIFIYIPAEVCKAASIPEEEIPIMIRIVKETLEICMKPLRY